ncbi:BON domain-containing protein [Georhizobium profundi]|jgi:osmotically-inducible protein OsmY|uniref:BON domain-containing protein n=1 Tax=Georhizobium profundi TaxID=2341112 RepID=A0A3Q8XPD9_9HYPH|nr:BON domain-containing protein [Georhizobium profundi]AZN71099.1 BON domain-containing protein [Georhizobium profundi]
MLDKTLRQNIIDALDFDPGLDAADIGVAVENGVVTLTGHVPTFDEKLTAEDLVKRIKGVRGIAQEIEVRPAGTHRTADDEIAKRALNVIRWNTTIPDEQIQVKVQKGWVTLTGKVEWQYQKNAAAGAVRGLSGVTGVSNMIEIRPRAEATDIKKRIEDAFKRDAELEAQSIRVDVHDGRVTLEGHVKVWADRQAAERAAWSAPGVTAVEDRITLA